MKKYLFILIFTLPYIVFSQTDTTYYFGTNGKVSKTENAKIRKQIKYISLKKVKVVTSKLNDENWQFLFSEDIKVVNDSTLNIRIKGNEFSGRISRRFEKQENGTYKFTDRLKGKIKRIGNSKTKMPLIFDGEVTEFYEDGKIKSISQYKNNELFTNKNWLSSGEKDIDDIFYSVDREPLFKNGTENLNQHILKTFKDAKVEFASIGGQMVIGFVVRTNGQIGGVRIVKGITGHVNAVALHAFNTIMGNWEPAKIDTRDVNYFQLFPINFIHHDYDFDSLELKGSMLYWEVN